MPKDVWTDHAGPASRRARPQDAAQFRPGTVWAVSLIDRRTGSAHRVNGRPLVIYSEEPDAAARTLLDGRDPSFWQVRRDPLQP